MRLLRFVLVGLLAVHAKTAQAATANASLSVSATVSSICAISSGTFGNRTRVPAGGPDPARVSCSPTAAYAISLDPRARDADDTRKARASIMPDQPMMRQTGLLVVEIRY